LGREETTELVRGMVEMGFADGEVQAEELEVIRQAAREFGFDDAFVGQSVAEVRKERGQRSRFVKSGAGIIIALVVIAIFVFTATFLKSVLFGLILAYFFLPIQRWYQHTFFPNPAVKKALAIGASLASPFTMLANRIKAAFGHSRPSHPEDVHEYEVSRACHAAVATLVFLVIGGTVVLVRASSGYVSTMRDFVTHAPDAPEGAAPQKASRKSRNRPDEKPTIETQPASGAQPPIESKTGSEPKPAVESQSAESQSAAGEKPAAESPRPAESLEGAKPDEAKSSDAKPSKDGDDVGEKNNGEQSAEKNGAEAKKPEADEPADRSGEGDATKPVDSSPDDDDDEPLGGGIPWLERYRPDLAKIPLLRAASEAAEEYLTNPEKRKELGLLLLKNLQPLVLRAGGVVTALATVLLDGMLTLFFFSFFLKKIALGQSRQPGRQRPTGQYLVETIFGSGWLPNASTASLREAQIIIDEILAMLQTWVQGYVWIIIIETIVYTTLFLMLGVPYAPIFGLLAGMTILLPFIGPILGCSLTLVVTFAVHSQSVTLATAIILVYFIVHGVVEQLILYPAFVGEALGLNTLETIIVVLLGGLLAGLAGVIFAVPAAAILKFLIPKIYSALQQDASQ
ncbi:MAG TPA: AI-2E family transporter, partial [Pirellulaceae bacterium]|nr:AI-2E family transporter [Pirellulaceae bacterium]